MQLISKFDKGFRFLLCVIAWPTKNGLIWHILKAKIKRPVVRKLRVMNL